MATQLAELTGMPEAEAVQFLEMAGGDVDQAIALYFEMGGGGGGGDDPMGVESAFSAPSSAHGVLFGAQPAPPSWSEQGFELSADASSSACLVQHKNGPCGVLAAINGLLIAQEGCPQPNAVVDDASLAKVLAGVLLRCAAETQKVVVASWSAGISSEVIETQLSASVEDVVAALVARINDFRNAGGVLLLCYSAVLTRGIDKVKADSLLDGGQSDPLVFGPYALCSTELMTLLTDGVARGNVSAYGADGQKVSWRSRSNIGMISRDEVEMGVPVADELKGPLQPVYVIHGGDHFTLLWSPIGSTPPPGAVDFVLWNGLPPNRALTRLRLRPCSHDSPPAAPDKHVQSHWKPLVGELESVVQACPEDKKKTPGQWRQHSYELALYTQVMVAEDQSESRPSGLDAPPVFDQGSAPSQGDAWRCAACYQTRFKTMCFGENAAPAGLNCKFCGRSQAEAGWTLWKSFDELPKSIQRRIDRGHGPKVLSVMRTRWNDVEISILAEDGSERPLDNPQSACVPAV